MRHRWAPQGRRRVHQRSAEHVGPVPISGAEPPTRSAAAEGRQAGRAESRSTCTPKARIESWCSKTTTTAGPSVTPSAIPVRQWRIGSHFCSSNKKGRPESRPFYACTAKPGQNCLAVPAQPSQERGKQVEAVPSLSRICQHAPRISPGSPSELNIGRAKLQQCPTNTNHQNAPASANAQNQPISAHPVTRCSPDAR